MCTYNKSIRNYENIEDRIILCYGHTCEEFE